MENKGIVQVYCGPGKGKTSVAIGQAIRAIGHGKTAIVIQFLKGRATSEVDYLSALEPNVKLFRFEKKNKCYEDLTEEERQEENFNIRNGLNYAKKVLVTQECDMLILDEVLGAVEFGIISDEDVVNLIQAKDEEMDRKCCNSEIKRSSRPSGITRNYQVIQRKLRQNNKWIT